MALVLCCGLTRRASWNVNLVGILFCSTILRYPPTRAVTDWTIFTTIRLRFLSLPTKKKFETHSKRNWNFPVTRSTGRVPIPMIYYSYSGVSALKI
jgi:hypothetical protein